MKRQRGRNRGGGNQGKPQQNANRAFESNGPDNVKIRGNAQHVFERYQQLARDAGSSGDRVLAENYLQHAEHYFRVIRAIAAEPHHQPRSSAARPTPPASTSTSRASGARPSLRSSRPRRPARARARASSARTASRTARATIATSTATTASATTVNAMIAPETKDLVTTGPATTGPETTVRATTVRATTAPGMTVPGTTAPATIVRLAIVTAHSDDRPRDRERPPANRDDRNFNRDRDRPARDREERAPEQAGVAEAPPAVQAAPEPAPGAMLRSEDGGVQPDAGLPAGPRAARRDARFRRRRRRGSQAPPPPRAAQCRDRTGRIGLRRIRRRWPPRPCLALPW